MNKNVRCAGDTPLEVANFAQPNLRLNMARLKVADALKAGKFWEEVTGNFGSYRASFRTRSAGAVKREKEKRQPKLKKKQKAQA